MRTPDESAQPPVPFSAAVNHFAEAASVLLATRLEQGNASPSELRKAFSPLAQLCELAWSLDPWWLDEAISADAEAWLAHQPTLLLTRGAERAVLLWHPPQSSDKPSAQRGFEVFLSTAA